MNFILLGNFVYTNEKRQLITKEKQYAICENGICQGVFEQIPQKFASFDVIDYSDKAILPGFIDLHLHAPQYEYRATDMDCTLIEWLNKYTFPTESKFADVKYADYMYDYFVNDIKNSEITRACIFATIHKDATIKLMEKLDKTYLKTFVGKVNMDRNAPDFYVETTQDSLEMTESFISECNFENSKPIITPRFTPTCSNELMQGLGEIAVQKNIPIQSHLSENDNEIEWVKELCPDSEFYGQTYDKYNLFGNPNKTIMAHCVLSCDKEIDLMKENGVFVAHCPSSNANLMSGIAPIYKYLSKNLNVGFGCDVAGGQRLSIFNEMVLAIQLSKMFVRYVDKNAKPLTFVDVLYMATLAGGKFFGKVGSFEAGYEFDAIIIDDKNITTNREFNLQARTERIIYLHDECEIISKYVAGKEVLNTK